MGGKQSAILPATESEIAREKRKFGFSALENRGREGKVLSSASPSTTYSIVRSFGTAAEDLCCYPAAADVAQG